MDQTGVEPVAYRLAAGPSTGTGRLAREGTTHPNRTGSTPLVGVRCHCAWIAVKNGV